MADRQSNQTSISRQLLLMGHRNRTRLRQWSWMAGGLAGGLLLLWLTWGGIRGECRIYQSGPLSTAHKLIENDCAKCHENWGVLTSLVGDTYRSVPNHKCESCHAGLAHFTPVDASSAALEPHAEQKACVSCHSEHNGDSMQAIADMTCTACHADLGSVAGHSKTFAPNIGSLLHHPEFAIHRLTDTTLNGDIQKPGSRHLAHTVVANKQRGNGQTQKWQDSSNLNFSHATHLKADLAGNNGETLQCDACHSPGVQREYFKPISFEQHCQKCHQLIFDTEYLRDTSTQKIVSISDLDPSASYETLTVPHESPEAVRGYLTDIYAIQSAIPDTKTANDPTLDIRRVKPSEPLIPQELTEDATETIQRKVGLAQTNVVNFTESDRGVLVSQIPEQSPLGQQLRSLPKKGGCGYCHETSSTKVGDGQIDLTGPMWQILPTNVPNPGKEDLSKDPPVPGKWLGHARFNHDAHRLTSCTTCHYTSSNPEAGVAASTNAGDVLMPRIDVCRQCHTQGLISKSWFHAGVAGAKTACVECHSYHHRSGESVADNEGRTMEAISK